MKGSIQDPVDKLVNFAGRLCTRFSAYIIASMPESVSCWTDAAGQPLDLPLSRPHFNRTNDDLLSLATFDEQFPE